MQKSFRWIRREIVARLLPLMPEPMQKKLVRPQYRWVRNDLKLTATATGGEKRLLIAPANYGSQGYHWARAAETIPGVVAVNLRFLDPAAKVRGPADFSVKKNVGRFSHIWARRQRKMIRKCFTHVLIEAELPILSPLYAGDLITEINDLEAYGIKVALVSHGSDTRLPSAHRNIEPNSPFVSSLDGLTPLLEDRAKQNLAIMDELALPEFVSTPDLLEFRPNATWLPGITEPNKWLSIPPTRLTAQKLVVLHVPGGKPALKGTPSIRPAMLKLQEEGLIEYRELRNVPAADMPTHMMEADIVVNQVSMGLYATVAVEAMLAGRIVVSQVWGSVREHIEKVTGNELPIVDATRDSVYETVKEIAQNRSQYASLGEISREFAKSAHSYEHAARALAEFLES